MVKFAKDDIDLGNCSARRATKNLAPALFAWKVLRQALEVCFWQLLNQLAD